ncbi:hypothetical protein [Methylobacterium durans]|uniref:Neuroendocrine-specific golgi family protein P55 (NESP55) n=1 Tax=Methylobacterium durans TaxID=2202825 RepID=A0A2U8W9X2_9HYPH|nr:hypothetical protein [Methylobacterium durans]AWN42799.1 hypothetical protein DK389_22715 [Methylobacterium durans]
MLRYLIAFHKVVSDATGYDRCTLQRQVVVTATSDVTAVEVAKTMFCEAAGIVDWRLRADACEITELVV